MPGLGWEARWLAAEPTLLAATPGCPCSWRTCCLSLQAERSTHARNRTPEAAQLARGSRQGSVLGCPALKPTCLSAGALSLGTCRRVSTAEIQAVTVHVSVKAGHCRVTTGAEGDVVTRAWVPGPGRSALPLQSAVRAKSPQSSDSLRPRGLHPTRLLCPWDSPGKNTGEGCHALLQGIFPTQVLNPRLLHLPALAGGFFTTGATWEAAQIKHTRRHSSL